MKQLNLNLEPNLEPNSDSFGFKFSGIYYLQFILIISISVVSLICLYLIVKLIKYALKWRSKSLAMEREIQYDENAIHNIGYHGELDSNQFDRISVGSFGTAMKDSTLILPNTLPSYNEYLTNSCDSRV
jgi:hypothetical protein